MNVAVPSTIVNHQARLQLVECVKRYGLRETARRVGRSHTAVRQWCDGRRPPPPDLDFTSFSLDSPQPIEIISRFHQIPIISLSGEKGQDGVGRKRQAVQDRDRDRERVSGWYRDLMAGCGQTSQFRRVIRVGRGGRAFWGSPAWVTVEGVVTNRMVDQMLWGGKLRVALRGVESTRLFGVDLDVHQSVPVEVVRSVPLEPATTYTRRVNRAGWEWRLSVARETAERIIRQAGSFGLSVWWERTGRGLHGWIQLDRAVSVDRAAWWASRMADVMCDPGCSIESFPKIRQDGRADMMAMPFGGPARPLDYNLQEIGSTRLQWLIKWIDQPVRVEQVEQAFGQVEQHEQVEEPAPVSGMRVRHVLVEPVAPDGQLFGQDFVQACLHVLDQGIQRGRFWQGSGGNGRHLLAAIFYLGHDDRAAELILARMAEDPKNTSETIQNPVERRRVIRDRWRHFQRGVLAGRCWVGMESDELAGRLQTLLDGKAPYRSVPLTKLIHPGHTGGAAIQAA